MIIRRAIEREVGEKFMLIKRLLRRFETDKGVLAAKQPHVHSPKPPVARIRGARKTSGRYPTLRTAIVTAINRACLDGRNRSDLQAVLRAEELVEVTELALLSHCHSLFDAQVSKLRMELVAPDSD